MHRETLQAHKVSCNIPQELVYLLVDWKVMQMVMCLESSWADIIEKSYNVSE